MGQVWVKLRNCSDPEVRKVFDPARANQNSWGRALGSGNIRQIEGGASESSLCPIQVRD